MYNMYSCDFAGSTHEEALRIKLFPCSATNGRRSRAHNNYFIFPHEEVPGSNPWRGKQPVFFKVIKIDYYIFLKSMVEKFYSQPIDIKCF